LEAEAWDGPSVIIAYSHCIAHGYDLVFGCEQQKLAVQSAYWPLFRYNPRLGLEGKNPFQLDSRPPALPLEKYIYNETRYTMLVKSNPEAAKKLLEEAQHDVAERWKLYEHWAKMPANGTSAPAAPAKPAAEPQKTAAAEPEPELVKGGN
jgi:pyruvate-ferredoxin/flavodoxin oxidoreductase